MITFKEFKEKTPEIRMDIPLLIRVFEYVREDVKSDVDLHKVVERLIALGAKTLTMADYPKIEK